MTKRQRLRSAGDAQRLLCPNERPSWRTGLDMCEISASKRLARADKDIAVIKKIGQVF